MYHSFQVHSYIQYMIAWRNVIWDEEQTTGGKPTSYLIALLIIKAYEISTDKSKQRFDRAKPCFGQHMVINYMPLTIIA